MTDDLFTHTSTLLEDLVTVTVNNGFLHISKSAQRRWLASAISKTKNQVRCEVPRVDPRTLQRKNKGRPTNFPST
jgi:hypothetical protein